MSKRYDGGYDVYCKVDNVDRFYYSRTDTARDIECLIRYRHSKSKIEIIQCQWISEEKWPTYRLDSRYTLLPNTLKS